MSQETQHFEGTVEKVTTDGRRVSSSYLDPGERLASEVDAQEVEEAAQEAQEEGRIGPAAGSAAGRPGPEETESEGAAGPQGSRDSGGRSQGKRAN